MTQTLKKIKLLNPEYPNKSTGIINGQSSGILNWNDIAYPQMYDLYQTLVVKLLESTRNQYAG